MLNGKYCGNCANWINTRATPKGKLPYWGECKLGYPLRKGKMYRHKLRGHEYMARHASFKIRTDPGCKRWEKSE